MTKETRKDNLLALMDKQIKKYEKLLPSSIDSESWLLVAKNYISSSIEDGLRKKKGTFLDAEINSVLAGIEKAAKDGLFLDGKESCLTIFNNNVGTNGQDAWVKIANYQAMTQGLIKLVRNTGEVKNLVMMIVYQNEPFKYFIKNGLEELYHEPMEMTPDKRGKKTGAYAAIVTNDNVMHCCLMSLESINKIKNASKTSKDSTYWLNHPEEMEKKTPLRKLFKRISSSVCPQLSAKIKNSEMEDGDIELDSESETDTVIDVTVPSVEIAVPETPAKAKIKAEPVDIKGNLLKGAKIHIEKGDKDGLQKWYKALSSEEKKNFTNEEIKKLIKETEIRAEEIKAKAAKKTSKVEEFLADDDCPFDTSSEEILEDDPM